MKRRFMPAAVLAVGLSFSVVGCTTVGEAAPSASGAASSAAPAGDKVMVTVVKAQTIPWFQRMAEGVKAFAERTKIDARQEGADDVAPEKQVKIIEDLIAQRPTAITVVPNSPEALESALAKAREQGIIVVSHEATGMKNVDIDIEAFDNAALRLGHHEEPRRMHEGQGQVRPVRRWPDRQDAHGVGRRGL